MAKSLQPLASCGALPSEARTEKTLCCRAEVRLGAPLHLALLFCSDFLFYHRLQRLVLPPLEREQHLLPLSLALRRDLLGAGQF